MCGDPCNVLITPPVPVALWVLCCLVPSGWSSGSVCPLQMTVVTSQLSTLLCGLAPSHWDRIVIAYEPVWAIGTGKVASPAQVAEVRGSVHVCLYCMLRCL